MRPVLSSPLIPNFSRGSGGSGFSSLPSSSASIKSGSSSGRSPISISISSVISTSSPASFRDSSGANDFCTALRIWFSYDMRCIVCPSSGSSFVLVVRDLYPVPTTERIFVFFNKSSKALMPVLSCFAADATAASAIRGRRRSRSISSCNESFLFLSCIMVITLRILLRSFTSSTNSFLSIIFSPPIYLINSQLLH